MSVDRELERADLEKIGERVRKLLRLAERGGTPEEAAAAAAKAQQLLAAYNLDMATVGGESGEDGRREEQKVRGGMYKYEQELWEAVAELNFCLYLKSRYRHPRPDLPRGYRMSFQHRVIGRTVNARATISMAQYLQQTCERLSRERYPGQPFLSDAVAYREGIASRVCEKLYERRRELLRAEDKKRKAEEALRRKSARDGISTSTAVTLSSLKQTEEDANMDFLVGEDGWSARSRAERAAARQKRAEADREAERTYAEWAQAHPEEAEAERKKEEARERRNAARRTGGGRISWRESGADRRRDSGAYYAGYDKGADVGIDQQAGSRDEQKRIGR
jgi:Protein of unknown function (DUF2786)